MFSGSLDSYPAAEALAGPLEDVRRSYGELPIHRQFRITGVEEFIVHDDRRTRGPLGRAVGFLFGKLSPSLAASSARLKTPLAQA